MRLGGNLRPSSSRQGRERFDGSRAGSGSRGENGAVLILALVFLIVVGGIVGVLGNSISAHLEDSTAFSSGRSLQYAATSAVDIAIQNIRYSPFIGTGETLNASPPSQCWNPDPSLPFNPAGAASQTPVVNGQPAIDVWCSTVWNPESAQTRVVTISACEETLTINSSAYQCATDPFLQVQVAFDDYPSGVTAPNPDVCTVYCGSGETILSWLWSPLIPVVDYLYTGTPNNSGPITGQLPIKLEGTGFVQGATTVNFIPEGANPAQATAQTGIVPTSISMGTGTGYDTLYAVAPAVTAGTTYYVTVTTPSGTSPTCTATGSTCYIFTYTPSTTPPVVLNISVSHVVPAKGSINGGDIVTINGSGFFAGAQVSFVPVTTGTTVSASDVVITGGGDTITAETPSVVVGTNYFIEVTTAGGTSKTVNSNADVYQYVVPSPVVSGIALTGNTASPTATGPPLSQLALTGASFFSGASVRFYANNNCSGGTYSSATSVTVNSPFSISVQAPSGLSVNGEYCVAVTDVGGTSSNQISFTVN
jgi:IPT/TIG domain